VSVVLFDVNSCIDCLYLLLSCVLRTELYLNITYVNICQGKSEQMFDLCQCSWIFPLFVIIVTICYIRNK